MYSHRKKVFMSLFIGLPIIAYVMGFSTYPMFSKSEFLVKAVSAFPSLINFSEIVRDKYGEPEELRSLVTSFYFIILLAIQCLFVCWYAVMDVIRKTYGRVLAIYDVKTIAATVVLFFFAYLFFFPPSEYPREETQIGRLFTETDLIYVMAAFIFRLVVMGPYLVVVFCTRAAMSHLILEK